MPPGWLSVGIDAILSRSVHEAYFTEKIGHGSRKVEPGFRNPSSRAAPADGKWTTVTDMPSSQPHHSKYSLARAMHLPASSRTFWCSYLRPPQHLLVSRRLFKEKSKPKPFGNDSGSWAATKTLNPNRIPTTDLARVKQAKEGRLKRMLGGGSQVKDGGRARQLRASGRRRVGQRASLMGGIRTPSQSRHACHPSRGSLDTGLST